MKEIHIIGIKRLAVFSKYLLKSYWEIIDSSQCQQLSPIIFVLRRDFQQVITKFGEIFNINRANTAGRGKQTKNKYMRQHFSLLIEWAGLKGWWWWWLDGLVRWPLSPISYSHHNSTFFSGSAVRQKQEFVFLHDSEVCLLRWEAVKCKYQEGWKYIRIQS